MIHLLKKYGNIVLTTTTGRRTVSFMPVIPSTSDRLHSEFVRLLFLQSHRETDHFFADSGVHPTQTQRDMFHFRHTVFSAQLKTKGWSGSR
jgi:hypothetical protein